MQLRKISFGSSGYNAVLALRDQVLRVPLGLSVYDEDLDAEQRQQAFGLFTDTGSLAACLMIVPLTRTRVKLRQMAVHPEWQKQGLGRKLVLGVEHQLYGEGIETIELHARTSAVEFYRALGYEPDGPEFEEVGIPHQKLRKHLTRAGQPSPSATGSG